MFGYFLADMGKNTFSKGRFLRKKTKFLNLGQEIRYFGVLGNTFENLLSYLKSDPPKLGLIAKDCARIKIHIFGTMDVLFGYFWAGI